MSCLNLHQLQSDHDYTMYLLHTYSAELKKSKSNNLCTDIYIVHVYK